MGDGQNFGAGREREKKRKGGMFTFHDHGFVVSDVSSEKTGLFERSFSS